MDNNLLTVQNLCAWYSEGKNVLSDFSLQLNRHEVVGLIGLNGAGKTTFLKTLSGLHETFRCNSIFLHGRPVMFRDKNFKLCRYTVFAEDNSFQYFTFREYLSYVAAAYKTELPNVSALVQGFHFEDFTVRCGIFAINKQFTNPPPTNLPKPPGRSMGGFFVFWAVHIGVYAYHPNVLCSECDEFSTCTIAKRTRFPSRSSLETVSFLRFLVSIVTIAWRSPHF